MVHLVLIKQESARNNRNKFGVFLYQGTCQFFSVSKNNCLIKKAGTKLIAPAKVFYLLIRLSLLFDSNLRQCTFFSWSCSNPNFVVKYNRISTSSKFFARQNNFNRTFACFRIHCTRFTFVVCI